MEGIDKLRQMLLELVSKHGPPAFYDAVVIAVDDVAYSCTVSIDDEIELQDVRLRGVISDNQSTDVLPAVGAQVMIGKIAHDDYIVLACDQITSYRITVGTSVFTVDATGTLISNGAETLNKILTDLVTAVLSIAAAKDMATLTQLLERINTLLK